MKTIYLIRHSGPFVEIDNYINNDKLLWDEFNKNMILSTLGEKKAKELTNINELHDIDAIYSSNSVRAIATAKYLAEQNNLKIKLDNRINERKFGVKYFNDIPSDFTIISFKDKNYKLNNGESLNEVDNRFKLFINELLDKDYNKVVIVLHGIILLSYLETISSSFKFDGNSFNIKYNNKVILDGKLNNPSVYKLVFDNNKMISDIECLD